MIVLTDREVSNVHGAGVLLKNILNGVDEKNNFVLCTYPLHTPDSSIPHYFLDDFSLFRGSKRIRKLLLSDIAAKVYLNLKRPNFSAISIEEQSTVIITFYSFDVLWRVLKFIRLFPDKKYILFMMDNFLDFDDSEEGLLSKKAFTFIASKAHKRLAISFKLANDLENITNQKFEAFYGPRIINLDIISKFHNQQKEHKICFVGNAWVEEVLPVVDEQLRSKNITVTWFTNKNKFEELKQRFNLTNLVFGGSFSSEDIMEVIARFRFGLILFGLETKAQHPYNEKLQEYSIPSKIIDYSMAGVEPIYYGMENTACYEFLTSHKLGVLTKRSSFIDFLDNFEKLALKPIEFDKMKSLAQECSIERFRQTVQI